MSAVSVCVRNALLFYFLATVPGGEVEAFAGESLLSARPLGSDYPAIFLA